MTVLNLAKSFPNQQEVPLSKFVDKVKESAEIEWDKLVWFNSGTVDPQKLFRKWDTCLQLGE